MPSQCNHRVKTKVSTPRLDSMWVKPIHSQNISQSWPSRHFLFDFFLFSALPTSSRRPTLSASLFYFFTETHPHPSPPFPLHHISTTHTPHLFLAFPFNINRVNRNSSQLTIHQGKTQISIGSIRSGHQHIDMHGWHCGPSLLCSLFVGWVPQDGHLPFMETQRNFHAG